MSRLFYLGLEGVGRWDYALGHALYHLGPHRRYLRLAKEAIENRKLRLSWTLADASLSEQLSQRWLETRKRQSTGPKRRHRQMQPLELPDGAWIVLEPPPDNPEEPEKTFEQFLAAVKVHDHERCYRDSEIKVQGRDEEARALLLARAPAPFTPGRRAREAINDADTTSVSLLFLRPETYNLERQEMALSVLIDTPVQGLDPLIRLTTVKHTWPPVFTVFPDPEWCVLTDRTRDGTDEQRAFVEIALATPDFALLEGPPGSGKTTAICELILQMALRGKRVLLVASTHVAVDNVLEKIIAWQDRPENPQLILPIRIGDADRVTSYEVLPYQLEQCKKSYQADLLDFLDNPTGAVAESLSARDLLRSALHGKGEGLLNLLLESANLVCGTTIGILQHPHIKNGGMLQPFDMMILDEASKTTFTEFLVPAIYARRWVVVGDIKQLAPYVDEGELADNLGRLLSKEEATVCLDVFMADRARARERRACLVAVRDRDEQNRYLVQAQRADVPVADLDALSGNELLYANLVVGTPEAIARSEGRLPGDIQVLRGRVPSMPGWERHRAACRSMSPDEETTWQHELAWRLVRAWELRQDEEERDRYVRDIQALIPGWYEEPKKKRLKEDLDHVRRVALPSILELLQAGFERREGQREGVALTDGLPPSDLEQRMISLRYQHRMDPAISLFPREHFYTEADGNKQLLQDASGLEERPWSYHGYAHRAIWIQARGDSGNRGKSFNRAGNRNEAEAERVMQELERFLSWAKENPPRGRRAGYYEVAVLTFYRGQESELRWRLRQLSGQSGNTRNFLLPQGTSREQARVHVTLCTVDRFQGHEADMVLLSFVKNKSAGGVGFLNSPNRINVALTRSKFQLVLIGDQIWFQGGDKGRDHPVPALLRDLATEVRRDITF